MDTEEYLYVYFSIIGKAAELYPTSSQEVVYKLSLNDNEFNRIVQKVGEGRMTQQLRQLFIELTEGGIFRGVVTKQETIISAVTPLGYSIIEQSKKTNFWENIKKSAPKWAVNSLTNFLIAYLTK